MKIISKVEINYFRSSYGVTLSKNNDINLLVGGNDSGKSNILKALNLFFNNETELGVPFYFYDDLSRLREKEARAAKGRASVWIKITFKNFLKWKSLPDEFSIKRTWNRYEDRPLDAYSEDLTPSTVGRFLNKLSFHYIPAIRGRDIYAHYLNALHDALIEDEKAGVKNASVMLMESINQSTTDMSERIKTGLNIDSSIKVPEDLRDLFSALDFSTRFYGYDIPLQKRGDGIQARHIPFILDFIARHSNKHHIWGYEEPENSLELSKAFELAEQFEKDFSKENQIFLTTHSPAFYDLSGSHVSKWQIRSAEVEEGKVQEFTTLAMPIGVNDNADESLGIAALISSRAKQLYQEINELNITKNVLDEKVALASRMQVIVEGPTDKKILEIAFSKLFPEEGMFCEFISADGCNNLTFYLKARKTLAKNYAFSTIGIYDNDHAGRGEMQNFKSHKNVDGHTFKEISGEKRLYCGLLPIADELEKVAHDISAELKKEFPIPLSIEYMFSPHIVNTAIEQGVLTLVANTGMVKHQGIAIQVDISNELNQFVPDDYRYLVYSVDESTKVQFANWVEHLNADDFTFFRPLFDTLRHLA